MKSLIDENFQPHRIAVLSFPFGLGAVAAIATALLGDPLVAATVYVDSAAVPPFLGTAAQPFAFVTDGVTAAATNGGPLDVKGPHRYYESFSSADPMSLEALNGPVTIGSNEKWYKITFTEDGLPAGAPWTVAGTKVGLPAVAGFNLPGYGEIRTSTSKSITFMRSPGSTLFYTICDTLGDASGDGQPYTAAPWTGTLPVANADMNVHVLFRPFFTIATLPDIQYYTAQGDNPNNLPYFYHQVDWIISPGRDQYNIQFVSQLGDLINGCGTDEGSRFAGVGNGDWGTSYNYLKEWQRATYLFQLGYAGMRFSVVGGNHDDGGDSYGADLKQIGWQYLNHYFNPSFFRSYPWYRDCGPGDGFQYGGNANSFETFSVMGQNFLILNIECDLKLLQQGHLGQPGIAQYEAVMQWASDIVTTNSDYKVIVVTHAYIGQDSVLQDDPYGKVSGNVISNAFVANSSTPNILMVLCGHAGGGGYLEPIQGVTEKDVTQTGGAGQVVYASMQNYQDLCYNCDGAGCPCVPCDGTGGGGWLRLFEFCPGLNRIKAVSYSRDHPARPDPLNDSRFWRVITQSAKGSISASNPGPHYGQPITFTACLDAAGLIGSPGGSITFSVDGSPFSTNGLSGMTATSNSKDNLPIGKHIVVATYSDENYQCSMDPVSLSVEVTGN